MTPVEMVASLRRAKAYTAEARENAMRIGMRWSLEDAEREVDAVLAALQATPVADSAAARWHVGQMALYRRLETLAKDDEWRGARRDDGLAAEMRFKADMHEQAARALSRPELPEPATPAPADDDAAETCETCREPITGRIVWSWDDVPLCEACAEPEAPIPGDGRCRRCRHYHLLGEVCGAPQTGRERRCDCDLRVIPEGLPTAEDVRGILPAPVTPPAAETRLENAGSRMLDFIEQSWRAGLRAHPEDEPEDAGSLRGRWFLRGKAFAANERAVLAYPSPPSEGPTP